MMKFLTALVFSFFLQIVLGQNFGPKDFYLLDSLDLATLTVEEKAVIDNNLKEFHSAKSDTTKLNFLNTIVESSWNENIWIPYNLVMHDYAFEKLRTENDPIIRKKLKYYLGGSTNNIGYITSRKGDMEGAIIAYERALQLFIESGDKATIATAVNNLAVNYREQGNLNKGLKYTYFGLDLYEELRDTFGVGSCYLNIAVIYRQMGDTVYALKMYDQSEFYFKAVNNERGLAAIYQDKGSMAMALKKYYQAEELLLKSLKLRRIIGDKSSLCFTLTNLGDLYEIIGNRELAVKYFMESLEISREMGYKERAGYALIGIGKVKLKEGALSEAKIYCEEAFEMTKYVQKPYFTSVISKTLSIIYEKTGNYKDALMLHKIYITTRDSLTNAETVREVAKSEAQYEYEKKKAIDETEHQKEIAVEKEAKSKQRIIIYTSLAGAGSLAIFLIIVFNRLKITRKQKRIIESQKEVVEQARSELQEKNEEILDSITYAKRIQTAILPPDKLIKKHMKDAFIFYLPKDIVAGDFYWMEVVEGSGSIEDKTGIKKLQPATAAAAKEIPAAAQNCILFAAADCTGHGVPGAMVSVICNNGLNRSVREHGITEPGKILDKTREIVIAEFEKSEEEVKDGMDISLCAFNPDTKILQWAGANNPLWIIRSGELLETKPDSSAETSPQYELIEVKADKQPIGKVDNPQPYTTHKIELQKGDSVYIFTDGLQDQFGGEKGKKFKAANFKNLLLSVQDETMESQKKIIDGVFNEWRGKLEQVDDVCIIGMKI